MASDRDEPIDVTVYFGILVGALLAGLVGLIVYRVNLPSTNPWDGCELIQSAKTEERHYCGKACSMPVYADTYQCGREQKTWLNARWSIEVPRH